MRNNEKKVLLINPANFGESWGPLKKGGGINPPLGLLYLSSVLKKNGFKVFFLDANIQNLTAKEAEKYIREVSPDIVGITAVTATFNYALEYLKVIKKINPKILTVIGGPHISAVQSIKDYQEIDIGVIGEGEYTFLEICEKYEKEKGELLEKEKIKGIVFRKGEEEIKNEARPLIANLDELPIPDYKILGDIRKYRVQIDAYRKYPVGTIISSRGCPYHCIFCDRNIFGNRYRAHSPERIIEEIKILVKEMGCREIKFVDDMFTLQKERVDKICELIKKEKLKFNWSCSLRADFFYEDMLKKMKEAGLWMVNVGIESGNQEILKKIKKSLKLETVSKTVSLANKLGIYVRGFFILGHPGETKETMEDTLNFVKSLPLYTAQFSLATPFIGTELFYIAEKYGYRDLNINQYSEKFPVFIPEGLTKEDLLKMHRRCYKEFYLRPKQLLKYLLMLRSFSDLKRYYLGLSILINMIIEFILYKRRGKK